jgi:hypothetical protein
MSKRAAMWPTALSADKDFAKLGPMEQLLFMKLWLSSHLDYAGFHALQISKWARGFTPEATEDEMRQIVADLERRKWIAVDYDTEEVLVVPFIRLDAAKQPQIYVAACRAIQAAQSSGLRGRAWEQILIVHPPRVKHDKDKFPDPGNRREVMQQ